MIDLHAGSHAIFGPQYAEERDEVQGAAPGAAEREAWVSRILTCLDGAPNEATDPLSDNLAPSSTFSDGSLPSQGLDQKGKSQPCWGHLLSGGHSQCDANFSTAAGHFIKKFCATCAENGISVCPSRARLLPPDDVKKYVNPTSHHFWSRKHGLVYRIVNQTNRCTGAPIILAFVNDELDELGFEPIPDSLVLDGALHLILCKGTLVPSALCKVHLGKRASTPEESLEPSAAAPPVTPACMNPFPQLCAGYAIPTTPMDCVWGGDGSGRAACGTFPSDDPPPNSKRRRDNEVPLTALKGPIISTPAAATAAAAAAAAVTAATASIAAAQAASKASAAGSEPTDMQVARDLQPGAHDSFTQHTRNDRLALGCHPQAPQEPCSPTRVCLGLP